MEINTTTEEATTEGAAPENMTEAATAPELETPEAEPAAEPPATDPAPLSLEELLKRPTRPPSDEGGEAAVESATATGDEKPATTKKGKMKFPGDPRKGASAVINTLELLNMGMGVVIAKDWELERLDRYKFQPAMKAQAIESWADWVETWEIKTNLLWLPAALAVLGMFGATAFTAFQDRKDRERIAAQRAAEQAGAYAAASAAPPVPAPEPPADTLEKARHIFEPTIENRERTAAPRKRTESKRPEGAPFSEEEAGRVKFEMDESGFYVHHATTSQYLKKGQRHERPSVYVLTLIESGKKSAEIRKQLKGWKP